MSFNFLLFIQILNDPWPWLLNLFKMEKKVKTFLPEMNFKTFLY